MPSVLHNKRVLGLIAAFALAAFSLLVFGGSSTPHASPAAPYLSVAPAAPAEAAAGQDLLAALALLRTIRLDTSLFADPLFKSLSDWGKKIPPQPTGRRNPFAPLGAKPAAPADRIPAKTTPPPASVPALSAPPAPDKAGAGATEGDAGVWDFSEIEFDF